MTKAINYGQLMRKAVCGMIAEVLSRVVREGLPGKHHFFITFDTTHPGVDMAGTLRARYPSEMTIVLQEWFADLAVMSDRFSVTLNFGNVPEPMVVPFAAITSFVDPSVEFGVSLKGYELVRDSGESSGEPEPLPKPTEGQVVSLDKFRKH